MVCTKFRVLKICLVLTLVYTIISLAALTVYYVFTSQAIWPAINPFSTSVNTGGGEHYKFWWLKYLVAVDFGSHDGNNISVDDGSPTKLTVTDIQDYSKEMDNHNIIRIHTIIPANNVTLERAKSANTITLKDVQPEENIELGANVTHDEKFYQKWEIIQRERRENLRKSCRKSYNTTSKKKKSTLPNLYMDKKHKVLYCNTAKIAGTSWLRVFLVLTGKAHSTSQFNQSQTIDMAKRKLRSFRKIKSTRQQKILKTFTKFMFTRHPFERLLSAYNSQIGPSATAEHLDRYDGYMRELRKTIDDKYANSSADNANKTAIQQFSREKSNFLQHVPPFKKFLKYLIENPKFKNPHWNINAEICLPCEIDYDIIGRYETLKDDARYILHAIGAEDSLTFPSSAGSAPTDSSHKLMKSYQAVPSNIQEELFQRYKLDFDIFGYNFTVYS